MSKVPHAGLPVIVPDTKGLGPVHDLRSGLLNCVALKGSVSEERKSVRHHRDFTILIKCLLGAPVVVVVILVDVDAVVLFE